MSKLEMNKTYCISVPHGGYEEVDEYYNGEEGKVYLVTTAYKSAEIHVTPETQTELDLLNRYIDKDSRGTILFEREFGNIEFLSADDAYSMVIKDRQSGEELDESMEKLYFDNLWELVDYEQYCSLPITLTEVVE